MQEIRGNLWHFVGNADCICITTNASIKKNGRAVMGRGCAAEATTRYPEIDLLLGKALKNGNKPYLLLVDQYTEIWSFPVKEHNQYIYNPNKVVSHMRNAIPGIIPSWAQKATLAQIESSTRQLLEASKHWNKIILPRPGCGAGELSWETQVRPLLAPLLDSRFYIITY